jgi:hypothetical protein
MPAPDELLAMDEAKFLDGPFYRGNQFRHLFRFPVSFRTVRHFSFAKYTAMARQVCAEDKRETGPATRETQI